MYEAQGALQLYVDSIQPSGVGDLAIQFEQLKAKLTAEGLFATERKRPLPTRPKVVAVVSSPTGAAWKDVCHVFARRWPLVRVVLVACQVQGDGSAESIVRALRRIEKHVAELAGGGTGGRGTRADDRRARRRLDGGPLVVQRRAGRARDRGAHACRS